MTAAKRDGMRSARTAPRVRFAPWTGPANYSSGDDYVVEFLGYRFSFNADDFEQRVTAAAVKLGLLGRERARRRRDGRPGRARRAGRHRGAPRDARPLSRSPLGRDLPRRRRVARLLAEEARLPRRLARPSREGGKLEVGWDDGRGGVLVPRPARRARAARAAADAELARSPVPPVSVPRWYAAAGPAYLAALLAVDTQVGLARAARARRGDLARARSPRCGRSPPLARAQALGVVVVRDGRRGDRLARLGRLPLPAAQPAAVHPARARARLSQRARARRVVRAAARSSPSRRSARSAGGSPG